MAIARFSDSCDVYVYKCKEGYTCFVKGFEYYIFPNWDECLKFLQELKQKGYQIPEAVFEYDETEWE